MTTKKSSKDEKVCVLVSGGIDSLALLAHLSTRYSRIYPLYMQCGFRWEDSELFWLKKFLRSGKLKNVESLEILSLPLREAYGSHWGITGVKVPDATSKPADIFMPGRNLLFLAKGSFFCAMRKLNLLAIGVLKNCPFPDAGLVFFRRFENILSEALQSHVRIISPFIERTKEQVMVETKAMGFEYSFSCLNPKGYQHCGECFKCKERKKAFSRTGIPDRTHYYKKLPEAAARDF